MDISVIICTHNRAGHIKPCLESVARAIQQAPKLVCEILVVDNASSDPTRITIESWQAANPNISLKYLHEKQKGLSNARNTGIRHVQGQLVIFTDDDCRMAENYILEAHYLDEIYPDLVLRGGSVYLGCPQDMPVSVIERSYPLSWSLAQKSDHTSNLGDALAGCNMMMRKSLIDKIGFFDPLFGVGTLIPGGEDTDYIMRAYLQGYRIEYVPALRVDHFHGRQSIKSAQILLLNYAIGSGALYAKYFVRYPNFLRQAWWDLKLLIREIFSGKNSYCPQYDLSMKLKLWYCCKGFFLYPFSKLTRKG